MTFLADTLSLDAAEASRLLMDEILDEIVSRSKQGLFAGVFVRSERYAWPDVVVERLVRLGFKVSEEDAHPPNARLISWLHISPADRHNQLCRSADSCNLRAKEALRGDVEKRFEMSKALLSGEMKAAAAAGSNWIELRGRDLCRLTQTVMEWLQSERLEVRNLVAVELSLPFCDFVHVKCHEYGNDCKATTCQCEEAVLGHNKEGKDCAACSTGQQRIHHKTPIGLVRISWKDRSYITVVHKVVDSQKRTN